ncbi:MAG: hypothetical protein KAS29_05770, partial [Bacteroidales bacterium]|nr:hypothetical protein [Bacteroidales bacterium]
MNHIKITFLFLLVLMLTSNPVYSQDSRTLDTKVADLLVQIPADNQQQLERQMNLLWELEEPGLQKILDLIVPPGTGDDTKPRFAIESLSRYLSQQGKEKEKTEWETMLLKEIGNRHDTYVKSFLMSQLNYTGGDATIKSLSNYLMD